jgi:hypothetical protein
LARRLRSEGASRRDAERKALAHFECSPTTDRGEAVLAAVAATYEGPDSNRHLARRVRRAVAKLLRRELPELVAELVRREMASQNGRGRHI